MMPTPMTKNDVTRRMKSSFHWLVLLLVHYIVPDRPFEGLTDCHGVGGEKLPEDHGKRRCGWGVRRGQSDDGDAACCPDVPRGGDGFRSWSFRSDWFVVGITHEGIDSPVCAPKCVEEETLPILGVCLPHETELFRFSVFVRGCHCVPTHIFAHKYVILLSSPY